MPTKDRFWKQRRRSSQSIDRSDKMSKKLFCLGNPLLDISAGTSHVRVCVCPLAAFPTIGPGTDYAILFALPRSNSCIVSLNARMRLFAIGGGCWPL
jgi:hypothetical protein